MQILIFYIEIDINLLNNLNDKQFKFAGKPKKKSNKVGYKDDRGLLKL